jgi:hypothetical protein
MLKIQSLKKEKNVTREGGGAEKSEKSVTYYLNDP